MPAEPDELTGDRANRDPQPSPNGTPHDAQALDGALPSVPGFELKEVLVQCGLGIVYRATETDVGRDVALKMPATPTLDAETIASCNDGFRIVAQVQHPGVPPIYQIGALADGRPFAAMLLIHGPTLAELLTDRTNPSIDRVRFLSVFGKVCEAMAYVHARRVVHCDLKPQHVMIGKFGDAQVIGWGRAIVEGSGSRRPSGIPLGTPLYMPPEQARGEWTSIAPSADVFALGGILVEILTGRPTYLGESSAELIRKAASGDVAEALARLDYCGEDPSLVVLARRCLSADPAQRPADAGEVCRLLSAYRAAQEERLQKSESERLAATAIATEKEKRKQVQLMLLLVAGMFLITLGVFVWWQDRQNSLRKVVEGNRKAAENERDAAFKSQEIPERTKLKRPLPDRDRFKPGPTVKPPKPLPPPKPEIPLAPLPRDAGQPPPQPDPVLPDPD